MPTPIIQVDAFTDRAFAGNPAGVALLETAADAEWMQSVAAEMNLAETAFLVPEGDASYSLRWFTPTVATWWWDRVGAGRIEAEQASARGGRLTLVLDADRVRLQGRAVTTLRGELLV